MSDYFSIRFSSFLDKIDTEDRILALAIDWTMEQPPYPLDHHGRIIITNSDYVINGIV